MTQHYTLNGTGAAKKIIPFILILLSIKSSYAQNSLLSSKSSNQNIQSVARKAAADNQKSLRGNGMNFTQNKGQCVDMKQQLRPDILFKSEGGLTDVYIRKTGISYVQSNMAEVLNKVDEQIEEMKNARIVTADNEKKTKEKLTQQQIIKTHRLDVDFEGCNQHTETQTSNQVEGYSNYYYAHCSQGVTNVNSFNEITVKNIYNKIDIKYYGNKEHGIKYDIIVQPHADPKQIKLHWKGSESIRINRKGHLIIKTSVNELTESMPKVYQNINGKIVDVECKYMLEEVLSTKSKVLSEEGTNLIPNTSYIVHFELGTYNLELPLVIDPWVSYYGTGLKNVGHSVTTDPVGNAVFTGYTYSSFFPVSVGPFQSTNKGGTIYGNDAFVVKMAVDGNRMWATYCGGTGEDYGYGSATDAFGNVLISGTTESLDFPVGATGTNVVYQNSGNGHCAFLFKFDVDGNRLWATYFKEGYEGKDVTTDGNNVYLYGETGSLTGIATATAFQPVLNGITDVFLEQFTSAGNRNWGTYIGGSSSAFFTDRALDITYDPVTSAIYISGTTESVDFPVTVACHQFIFGGGRDAFLGKFSLTGTRLWITYYGGAGNTIGSGVATDSFGNVVLAGSTGIEPATVISTATSYQPTFGGGSSDLFVVKFNSIGTRLWGTYIGGNQVEASWNVAIDNKNNIYVAGEWEESDNGNYPISACAYQPTFSYSTIGFNEDQFIAKYSPDGEQLCLTALGGPSESDGDAGDGGIAISGNYLYVTGYTRGVYPVTPGAFQTLYNGVPAFIDQLCINLCEAKTLVFDFAANNNICVNTPIKFTPTVVNSCDTTGYRFHWIFTGGNPATSDSVDPTVTFSGVGNFDVKLVLTTQCKKDSIPKLNYVTVTSCGCTLVGQFTKGTAACNNCGCKEWVLVNAINGTPPYTYQWPAFGGYDKRYKNNVCPGNYTVKVTDKNGCSVDVNVSIP